MHHSSFDLATMAARGRRMARGTVLRSALAGTAFAILAPGNGFAKRKKRSKKKKPALALAYVCAVPGDSNENIGNTERYGQVFAATKSGSLRQVRLAVGKGSGSTPGNFIVQLLKTSAVPGIPDSSPQAVMAAVTIPDTAVPESISTVVANFAGTPLVAGTEYAVVVTRPDSDGFQVGYHGSPDVCAGTVVSALGSGAFSAVPVDFVVSVLVS